MSRFNAIAQVVLICRIGMKSVLTAAIVIVAAPSLVHILHSDAYADSPTTHDDSRAAQSSDDTSQALRRYTLQLLHILSNPDANQWQRYRQAIAHCAAAPAYLAEIDAGNPLDATLIALIEDLCADLDLRLDKARTVGLLVNEPESMDGYVLIPGRFNNDVHLIDHLGRVAHSWQFEDLVTHSKLLDNGNLLAETIAASNGSILEVDSDSNIVWKYTHPDIHHDFLNMPNGNLFMIVRGIKTREEAIAAGANPDIVPSGGLAYDYLIEVRPTGSEGGEIVWEWSAWDYIVQDFDPSKPNYEDPSEQPELVDVNFFTKRARVSNDIWDWTHTNAIDYNPALDQIMLSLRNHSELWIIDHSAPAEDASTRKGGNSGKGGALLYRWGNPRVYGHGTPADQRLFWQHHTQWIAPGLPGAGNILVFNNGYEIGKVPPYYSSIEEIVPRLDQYGYWREPGKPYSPTEPVWSYTAEAPTDFYSSIMGGVQRLPNGNTLICESTSGDLFQITPDGKMVWRYVYPKDGYATLKQGAEPSLRTQLLLKRDVVFNNAVYRAYWYAPDHPGLQKYDLTPGDTIEIYE